MVQNSIRAKVAEMEVPVGSTHLKLTVSIGASQYCPGESTDKKTMARAYAGLYDAKARGRNLIVWTLPSP